MNKRFLLALSRTILIFASLHLILLLVLAVWRSDYSLINVFHILDVTRIWPWLGEGAGYFVLGGLLGLGLLAFNFFWNKAD